MDQLANPTPIDNQTGDIVAINLIRVEGELSKYPIHSLSKKGVVDIAITKRNDKGEVTTKWQVTPNMAFGKPGPLAYKLDTIVINQKIDEADRPLPDFICLGSLYDIAKQLRLKRDTNTVKRALLQNASLFLTAKVVYKTNDGGERRLEASFTRYSFVFTGEVLPNGEEADAVYLVLNKVYKDVLNSSPRRPQDLDYIKTLTPAAHRFYHLLGPRMFATLNNPKGTHAMIAYSDYCQQAPQERYFELWKVKRQMNDVVRPHLRSGYLVGVEYESRRDDEQRPDWMMKFVPGSRARNEYYTATKDPRALRMPAPRRGRPRMGESLAKALSDSTPLPPPPVKINYYWSQPAEPAPSSVSETASPVSVTAPSTVRQQTLDLTPEVLIDPPLFLELTQRGIGDGKARQILQNLPPDFPVQDTLEWGDHQIAIQGEKINNPAGFQISLLEQRIIPPLSFETSRQKAARLEAHNARQREIQERQAAELQEETERKERSRRRLSILTSEQHAALQAKVTAELLTNPFYADKQGTATFAGIVLGFMLRELEGPMDLLVPPDSSARF